MIETKVTFIPFDTRFFADRLRTKTCISFSFVLAQFFRSCTLAQCSLQDAQLHNCAVPPGNLRSAISFSRASNIQNLRYIYSAQPF